MMDKIFVFLFGLIWGSFLNALAYRLLNRIDWFFTRSFCPECRVKLSWYELIPVISWLILRGRCRACKKPISWLYPFIEILSGVIMLLLYVQVPPQYFIAYFVFFSALIVTIRTDIEYFLILFSLTWPLVPFAVISAFAGFLPISLVNSILGMFLGYFFLWGVRKFYFRFTDLEGLGRGDLDLMGLIGAFVGVGGVLATFMVGSILGLLFGIVYYFAFTGRGASLRKLRIPYGPFLALGAIIYVLVPKLQLLIS